MQAQTQQILCLMLSISSAMRILLSPTGISDYPRAATSVRKHSTREDLPLHLTKQSHSCDVWRRPFPCPLPHSHASHVLDHTFYEFRLNHVSFHNLRQTQSPALVMTDLCLPAIFSTLFKDSIACCSLCCWCLFSPQHCTQPDIKCQCGLVAILRQGNLVQRLSVHDALCKVICNWHLW